MATITTGPINLLSHVSSFSCATKYSFHAESLPDVDVMNSPHLNTTVFPRSYVTATTCEVSASFHVARSHFPIR